MEDYLDERDDAPDEDVLPGGGSLEVPELSPIIDFDSLLKSYDLRAVAVRLNESSLEMADFMKKDIIDRFLDFVFFKIQTGIIYVPSMAYPTRRMMDALLEKKIMELINEHLYPEIIFRLLKFFTRNVHDADTNLYIANLVYSEKIIESIYNSYRMFKNDIFISDRDRRTLNVKRIQQYSSRSDNRLSSPLDAAVRLKYILEFFLIRYNMTHIYTIKDLVLSNAGRGD